MDKRELRDFTEEELLRELIDRRGTTKGPVAITGMVNHQSAVIGIGCDHSATILIHEEDLGELMAMT